MSDHIKQSGDMRIRTQSSWAKPTIFGVYVKNKDAASSELPSRLIKQEMQDESTDKSAGYNVSTSTCKC